MSHLDDLMPEARAIAVGARTGTIAEETLRRKMCVGFATAAALMDRLEREGVVGPPRGRDPRLVLKGEAQS